MNNNAPARPNRVVTCQTCGVQMPQRYMAKHLKLHEQAAVEAPAPAPENALATDGAPDPQPQDDAAPGQQPAGMLICPACAAFVAQDEFTNHMQALHTNWCPLCHTKSKDLSEHLRSRHLLKPIQPPLLYERNWDTQKRFICLGCKKKVSVWSYPRHELPHGATRGLVPRNGKAGSSKALPPGADRDITNESQSVRCQYCQQQVARSILPLHLANEHPPCPYCHQRQPRLDLNDHIQTAHSDTNLPE